MGRPKKGSPNTFEELDLEQVRHLAEYGHTDDFMSDFFNVSVETWHSWKKKNPVFFKALKGWKAVADDRVERALYERALGYEWEEEAVVYDSVKKRNVKIRIEKRLPPDVPACRYWLGNRRPQQWREKMEVDTKHSGAIDLNSTVAPFELDDRIKLLAAHAAEERVNQLDFGKSLEDALR
jgi:hypothetical protein